MSKLRETFDNFLKDVKKIGITSHINPDDDAVTSCLAINYYVKKNFPDKESEIILTGEKSDRWDYLSGIEQIIWTSELTEEIAEKEALIFVDGSEISRFTQHEFKLKNGNLRTFCIDHHIGISDKSFDEIYRDENAVACAQIIAENLFEGSDFSDRELSKILLVGIYDDSGNLTYVPRESFKVFDIVEKILKNSGINVQSIMTEKSNLSQRNFALFMELVDHTSFTKLSNKLPPITYSYYEYDTHTKFDANTLSYIKKYYANTVLREIKGHTWGFIDTPLKSQIAISFRSTPGSPNVQKLCERYFSGGGHKLTASGIINTDDYKNPKNLVEKILDDLECMDIEFTEP